MNINASIIGASGYTGLELINILSLHPNVTLKYLVSRSNSGKKVADLYPSLYALGNKEFSHPSVEEIAKQSDVVFLALPHGESASFCRQAVRFGRKSHRFIRRFPL